MLDIHTCWSYFLYFFKFFRFPLYTNQNLGDQDNTNFRAVLADLAPATPTMRNHPYFQPPDIGAHHQFFCEYPELQDYEPCSADDNRGCWLRPKNKSSGLPEYNTHTDYEHFYPKGILRRYNLTVTNTTLYPDGCTNNQCKVLVDEIAQEGPSFPGPWLRACWGDTVEVTINNNLTCNGTSIHWHGLRMLNNVENDGVNGVTQCPIAPGHSYTYKFLAGQYGTSWYHSHYSLQYADGVAGPLTIHGPSAGCDETTKIGCYDTAKDPILMADWNHRSAFEDWAWYLAEKTVPKMTSILLNGKGKYKVLPGEEIGDRCPKLNDIKLHSMVFQKGMRYLLRLVNHSVTTTYIFSIDGHNLTVIEADFVPIEPYTTNHVLLAVGQRYHVVVEATPHVYNRKGNYWIRTVPADGCSNFRKATGEPSFVTETGIIRYDPHIEADPDSTKNQFSTQCVDRPNEVLKPILRWDIPNQGTVKPQPLNILLNETNTGPYHPLKMLRWTIHGISMWLDFARPTLLNLGHEGPGLSSEVSVRSGSTTSNGDEWVELLLIYKTLITGLINEAHPIHLHGHDFAILAQGKGEPNNTIKLNRNNPPRRDVAILPHEGYLVIAFKMDNPGVWLLHCHIAWHVAAGLGTQIKENVDKILIHDQGSQQMLCTQWSNWFNYTRTKEPKCMAWGHFQEDSGI